MNHVIDPTFFYRAIEIFEFEYDFYRLSKQTTNEFYEQVPEYEHFKIKGSLQSQGSKIVQRKEGNLTEVRYDFYCKSLYRIDKGDLLHYKHKLLRVEDVNDYDEYGVRSCKLVMVQLSAYQDLEEYIKFVEGEELV